MQSSPGPNRGSATRDEGEAAKRRQVHPEDEADVRAALADLAAGRGIVLTEEQARHWAKTGEWPESLD